MKERATLAGRCLSELAGTFVLVFFGVGSVHAAVLTGAQQGLWQVAIVWGVAISLAIYATGAVSGAHINPAMTVAFAAFRGFPWRRVPPYLLSQLLGAILGAAVLHVLFSSVLSQFESAHGIVRGAAGSELSAMVYGEYFPNPAMAQSLHWTDASVSPIQAMLAEGIGTALLAFFVFAVTDRKNTAGPGGRLAPLFIGLTVSILISVIAPLTQAGFNPARDFGPRLFAYFAGWGRIAIPGPRGGFFTVYILSPVVGATLGSAVYEYATRLGMIRKRSERLGKASTEARWEEFDGNPARR
jgi:glycerol uptake facilitator protein